MTLKDFVLTDNNHFIACQKYNLFFKRVMLILITKNYLIGLVCNNSLNLESETDISLNFENNFSKAKRVIFQNPYSYLKAKMVKKIANKYLFDQSIFAVDKANFRLDRNDIKTVTHNITRPAYLSNHISDGTISIEHVKGETQKFDLLGDQSGKNIVLWILARNQTNILN